jgi:hypothetical protein
MDEQNFPLSASLPADGQTERKKRSWLKRLTWKFFTVLFLLLTLFTYWKYYFTYSKGNRTGLLQKLSYKGTIFKTYEGELILSSIRSQNNVAIASEKFFFSVTNEGVAKKLENLQGQFVTVHYKMKNGTLPWRGDSKYLVDSIRGEPHQ